MPGDLVRDQGMLRTVDTVDIPRTDHGPALARLKFVPVDGREDELRVYTDTQLTAWRLHPPKPESQSADADQPTQTPEGDVQ